MPALLVHLTIAKQTAARGAELAELGQAAASERSALLLGAVLPDLPYHARFGHQMIRHLLRREYLRSEWGDILHHHGTGRLALALLSHLQRAHLAARERAQVVALLAGYLSHLAVDTVLHPLIDALVTKHLRPGESPDAVHSRIERYQNLLLHLELLGVELFGSRHPRCMVAEVAGVRLLRPDLPEPLWQAFEVACLDTHGRAPRRAELRSWLWGIAAYGQLMSSPAGFGERLPRDREAIRAEFYQGEGVDLRTPLESAIGLTLGYWRAALHVLRAERVDNAVRRRFRDQLPDLDLSTGS